MSTLSMSRWEIETSHIVNYPPSLRAVNLEELRRQLTELANNRPGHAPLGELHFRYELDNLERVKTVHSFFTGRNGKQVRFMRLRRD